MVRLLSFWQVPRINAFFVADIDECKQGQCQGEDRICVNTLGSYKCHQIVCPENFVRDTQFKKYDSSEASNAARAFRMPA